MPRIRSAHHRVSRLAGLVALLSLFTFSVGLIGCENDGDPVAPGPGPGPGPGPDPGDPPGPDPDPPGGDTPDNTTNAARRAGLTDLNGSVALPGFATADNGSNASLEAVFRVVDENGGPISGALVTNLQQGNEFVGAIVPPDGNRGPRLFFSERLPTRVGTEERTASLVETSNFGGQITGSTSVAFEGTQLIITVEIPQDATIEPGNNLTSAKSFFVDDQLLDQLLGFDNLASFRGVFNRTQLITRVSDALHLQGGYVYFTGLIELNAQGQPRAANWQMNETIETDPTRPSYHRFLEPMLQEDDGSLATTYFVQNMQVTSDATKPGIELRFSNVFDTQPIVVNLGAAQRYVLFELNLTHGFEGFAGKVRKNLYIIPIAPRSVTLQPADGDPEFTPGGFEEFSFAGDYVDGSDIELFPTTTQTDLSSRVQLTAVPIRPGDSLEGPGPNNPHLLAVDELQRNIQGYFFLPDYYQGAPQDIQPPSCVNCLLTNQLLIYGPNGPITNLPPVITIGETFPASGSGRLSNGRLDVGFNLLGSSDADSQIVRAEVDWGDGTDLEVRENGGQPIDLGETVETSFIHAYTGPGTFTVTVRIYDNGTPQAQASTTTQFTAVPNAPPDPCATSIPPMDGDEVRIEPGATVRFDFSCSVDPDGPTGDPTRGLDRPVDQGGARITIDWGDGTTGLNSQPFTLFKIASHQYANASATPYVMEATITDGDGDSAIIQVDVIVEVTNELPIASASSDKTTGAAPLTVVFSSTGSIDPDGTITAYEWDFGDGTPISAEPNPTHIYTDIGTYTATLTVIDDSGLGQPFDRATDTIDIEAIESTNTAPQVTIHVPDPAFLDIPATFTADITDAEGDNVTYEWDFGDGGQSTDVSPQYTYTIPPAEGFYFVTLVVTDDGDPPLQGQGSEVVVVEEFDENAPWAIIEPLDAISIPVGGTIDFSGASSYSPIGNAITTHNWSFSVDGTFDSGPAVTKTFDEEAEWIVSLAVTDDEGNVGNTSLTVRVDPNWDRFNDFAFARATAGPLRIEVGQAINFSSVGSFDPEQLLPIQIIQWDFKDGTPVSTEANPSHTFTFPGLFQVALTVQEDLGLPAPERQTTAIVSVVINPPPPDPNPPVLLVGVDQLTAASAPASFNFDATLANDQEVGSLGPNAITWFAPPPNSLGVGFNYVANFDTPGRYQVTANANDGFNTTSAIIEVMVGPFVGDEAPLIDVTTTNSSLVLLPAIALNLDCSGSLDPNGDFDPATIEIDWGDSTVTTGATGSHTYLAGGPKQITITATDDLGHSAQRIIHAHVISIAP